MATFFGEVTEISSRAVWWSDSDDEPDESVISFGSFSTSVDVVNQDLLSNCVSHCKRMFVSVVKQHSVKRDNCIVELKSSVNGVKDKLAGLYQINQNEYWISISNVINKRYDSQVVKIVDMIFEKILSLIQSQFILVIVSSDISRNTYVQYLSLENSQSSECYLNELRRLNQMRPLQAPETFKNEVVLAFLEYCIVNKRSFVGLILPQLYNNIVPSAIESSLDEFKDLSYSNLVT